MSDTSKVIKDILDVRREFTLEDDKGNITSYYIADPSGEDIRKADWNYAKVFNQALADKIPTHAQMLEILKERGVLSEEYQRSVEKTKIDLAAALFRLEHMAPDQDEENEALAMETARLRDELFRLNQRLNGPLQNSCENMAEDSKNEYLTSRVIQFKDGKRIWNTFDDYLREPNTQLTVKCRFEVMLWLQGLDSNFMEKAPEHKVLRDLAEKRMNAALEVAKQQAEEKKDEDKPAEVVQELTLPEEAPAEAKKKGRKPKAANS